MHPFFSRIIVGAIAVTTTLFVDAQPRSDSSRSAGPGAGRSSGPKPFKEVITNKATTDRGLFSVHKVDDKYFFEIGDTIFGRELLVVNRISKAAAGMRNGFFGYAGDQVGQNVIRFEKGPNNKIFLRNVSFAEYSKDSTSPMFTAVNKSNVQPIAASFDIKSLATDSTGYVIDVTDYVNSDNDVLFFNNQLKSSMRIGSQQSDKSYINNIRSYPLNIEISTVKTYGRSPAPAGGGGQGGGGVVGAAGVLADLLGDGGCDQGGGQCSGAEGGAGEDDRDGEDEDGEPAHDLTPRRRRGGCWCR